MKKYLIDVNLPYCFSLWNSEEFIHQTDIDDKWTDTQIWNFAKKNNLTIITKDADFSHRIILNTPPPKVIHIRFGNLKLKDFFRMISDNWDEIKKLNDQYKLVNVFKTRIEGIG